MPSTPEQIDIIKHVGNLLVTAVPGSGKTRSIIDKVEKLVTSELDKFIIVITYTHRAADEVSERLDKRNISREFVWSGTIHRFCIEFIINPNLNLLPELNRGYEIIDEDDVKAIIEKCAAKLGISLDVNNMPDLTIDIDGRYQEARPQYINLVKEVYKHFVSEKLLNFDMILSYSYNILTRNTFVAKNIANACSWIIVDEYQDTKELQYQIIAEISAKSKAINLMFVGDPNQAIYSTLGGVVKDRCQLEDLYQRTFEVKHLTGCFRSNQRIIDFYSSFAVEREIIESKTQEFNKPYIGYFKNVNINDNGFATLTKNYIQAFHDEGIDYNDICVLLPWSIQLMNLASWFLRNSPEIPIDSPSITPLKKMDDGVWNNLVKMLFVKIDYSNIYYYEKLLKQSLYDLSSRLNIDCSRKYSDLLDYYISCNFNDEESAIDVIQNQSKIIFEEIIGLSESIYKSRIDYLLEATERKIRRFPQQLNTKVKCFKQCYRSKHGVVFSTFHGVKGEEYRAVIVGCLNEGYIPHFSRLNNREDSMKLLYVVMSRAKEKLVISSVTPEDWRFKINCEICNCCFNFDYVGDFMLTSDS